MNLVFDLSKSDGKQVVTISNGVSLLYVMPLFQREFFANNVDKNNRNKRNSDRKDHPPMFYKVNRNDIVNAVQFVNVSRIEEFEHQLKIFQRKPTVESRTHSCIHLFFIHLPNAVETAWRKLELLSNVTRPLPILIMHGIEKEFFFRCFQCKLTDICIYQYQHQHKQRRWTNLPLNAKDNELSLFRVNFQRKLSFSNRVVVVAFKMNEFSKKKLEHSSNDCCLP